MSALQDLTRRDILFRFYSDPSPKTAAEVAEAAGVHRSVAFDHLERLVVLGYLDTQRRRGFPGKPAKLYRLAQGPISVSHPPRQFALLADQLAIALAGFGPAGVEAARTAGRRLAATLEPGGGGASIASCLEPLEALGAAWESSGAGELVMTNCIFQETCAKSALVREFQAGLLEALLQPAEPGLSVEPAAPADSAGCRYRLRRAAEDAGRLAIAAGG